MQSTEQLLGNVNESVRETREKVEALKGDITRRSSAMAGANEILGKISQFQSLVSSDVQQRIISGAISPEVGSYINGVVSQLISTAREHAMNIDRALYAKQGELVECNSTLEVLSKLAAELSKPVTPPIVTEEMIEPADEVRPTFETIDDAEDDEALDSGISKVWKNIIGKKAEKSPQPKKGGRPRKTGAAKKVGA